MSYQEALEDNISIGKDKYGFEVYYPECHICGAPVTTWTYKKGMKITCPKCRSFFSAVRKAGNNFLATEKKGRKLEEAIKRISKVAPIEKYQRAYDVIKRNIDRPGWFQSTEEIMTALELVRKGLKIRHQVKIFNYSIDFVIPEYKVALEIDGRPFHGKDHADKQRKRDEVIIWKLSEDWEIIHIDTDNINANVTKLVPAIKAVLKSRKKTSL